MNDAFFNLYRHNFIRGAITIPEVRVADPAFNTVQIIALMRQVAEHSVLLAAFPELGLSAYPCEDLFQQQALLDGCLERLAQVIEASLSSLWSVCRCRSTACCSIAPS